MCWLYSRQRWNSVCWCLNVCRVNEHFFPTRISKSHHRHSALGIVSGNKHSLYTLIFSQKYLKITIYTEKMCEKRSVCEWRCVGTFWLHTATWRNAYLLHDYSMNDYTCFIFRYHIISTSARFQTVIVRDVLVYSHHYGNADHYKHAANYTYHGKVLGTVKFGNRNEFSWMILRVFVIWSTLICSMDE